MDRFLKPERFITDPNSSTAEIEWKHWYSTFENFLNDIKDLQDSGKLKLLINYISPQNFTIIQECDTYDKAVDRLKSVFLKPTNEIFARHQLATRCQAPNETIHQFYRALQNLSQECNFKAVSAQENKEEHIRDAFIRGIYSQDSRRQLLENCTLTMKQAYDRALTLEMAQIHSNYYSIPSQSLNTLSELKPTTLVSDNTQTSTLAVTTKFSNQKCYFCGKGRHPRHLCPAKLCTCKSCGKLGHFSSVCRTSKDYTRTSAAVQPTSQPLDPQPIDEVVSVIAPSCLSKSLVDITVNGVNTKALIDSGSSSTYIDEEFAKKLNLMFNRQTNKISMASKSLSCNVQYNCCVDLNLKEHLFKNLTVSVIPDCCVDFLIGHDVLNQFEKVTLKFKGTKPPLEICNLAAANVPNARLFQNLAPDCKPIITKSRRFSFIDRQFIDSEIQKLLRENVIEESNSPWRAQVVVISNENHKKRMCIDYSQTINRYTLLDAYPLPRMDDIVNKVAQYSVFSTVDLSSAYHQIPIDKDDSIYTAFEANGKLYQFCRIPFGVTNGVPCFQRFIDNLIVSEKLKGTFAYLDDVTICGRTQAEHDYNLDKFLNAVKRYNLTINKTKSTYSSKSISLLGYTITDNVIRPDPSRLQALLKFPAPKNNASLQRVIGMFAHYSKWIPNFSEKLRPLVDCKSFPMNKNEENAFENIKKIIASSAVHSIDETLEFLVETDASEHAVAGTLSQCGKPVAFYSRTLSHTEQRHSAIEREAYAIVECLRKWKHFLIGKRFKLITDQRSVSFMFDQKQSSKIKNDKILRWRIELACFNFDIIYRPGLENAAADAFSRVCASSWETHTTLTLNQLHSNLCHPGITRMFHFVRCKNLPYSLNEVREVTNNCKICCEIKPKFFQYKGTLIKATSPFERLNIDFKGPIPSVTRNRYFLTVIDEYSRFPFVFPCSDLSSQTVIKSLKQLFFLFGTPNFIHSDRGSSFMSDDVKRFLNSHGIAMSRTTAYNPQGNGQTERYNGVIWKTILLSLKSKNRNINQWETVVGEALHSMRSLLCTATNETPHERMFKHQRRSSSGSSIPSWLSEPGPVLMKRHANSSKYDPMVEEVTLLDANPNYAHVRLPNGIETTISLRHLAPRGTVDNNEQSLITQKDLSTVPVKEEQENSKNFQNVQIPNEETFQEEQPHIYQDQPVIDQSNYQHPKRARKLPRYLEDYHLSR